MASRNRAVLPQRTEATGTDTTCLLGGTVVIAGARTFRLIDSTRVAHRGSTA